MGASDFSPVDCTGCSLLADSFTADDAALLVGAVALLTGASLIGAAEDLVFCSDAGWVLSLALDVLVLLTELGVVGACEVVGSVFIKLLI